MNAVASCFEDFQEILTNDQWRRAQQVHSLAAGRNDINHVITELQNSTNHEDTLTALEVRYGICGDC